MQEAAHPSKMYLLKMIRVVQSVEEHIAVLTVLKEDPVAEKEKINRTNLNTFAKKGKGAQSLALFS